MVDKHQYNLWNKQSNQLKKVEDIIKLKEEVKKEPTELFKSITINIDNQTFLDIFKTIIIEN